MKRGYGNGSLIKIGNCRYWYAQYYDGRGRQIRVSTRTESQQEASKALNRLLGSRDRGEPPIPDVKKLRYGDLRKTLLDAYATQGHKSLQTLSNGDETVWGLKALDEFFGFHDGSAGWPVMKITSDAAREFARKRQSEGLSNGTVNGSLRLLRHMLRLAADEGRISRAPKIQLVKEPPPRQGFLNPDQFGRLLAALPQSLRPLITFLYYCGVRLGEARSVRWAQVDLRDHLVHLEGEQTKNDTGRAIPLPEVLVEMLKGIEPKEGVVFDTSNLPKEWMKACRAAGLGTYEITEKGGWAYRGLIVHDLRRSAIRNLVRSGTPETVAMRISGHKTRDVFERYNIVDTRDVRFAMQRLEAATRGKRVRSNSEKTVKTLPPAGRLLQLTPAS